MKNQVTTQVETITPFIAAEYLKHNTHNRAVNKNTVDFYAKQMKAGEWQLNGEPIIFSANGRLQDGQHRLYAVIKSNCSIKSIVVRDVDDDVFTTIDQGRARTVANIFEVAGITQQFVASSLLKKYWALHLGFASLDISFSRASLTAKRGLTAAETLSLYYEHEENVKFVISFSIAAYKKLKLLPPSEIGGVALFLIIDKMYSQEQVKDFFMELLSEPICQHHVLGLFRNILIKDKMNLRKMPNKMKLALLAKTWNAYISGTNLKQLKWADNEGDVQFK
jgi:hypothetical protein